jgi:hypothetical protein
MRQSPIDSAGLNISSMSDSTAAMMKVDLIGRISNIPLGLHRPLLPLFEAVINSIHAIQATKRSDGFVDIQVTRDTSQDFMFEVGTDTRPIIAFTITDNGIGFDEENFESFTTSDTKHKPGAKGIGRFMWLKAFELVQVKSIFRDGDKLFKRSFNFTLSDAGLQNISLSEVSDVEVGTEVRLLTYKERYAKACPKRLDLIAERLIEHCLTYFLSDNCPRISLSDSTEHINLNEHFNVHVKAQTTAQKFTIKNEFFNLVHLRLYSSNEKNHEAHICGNDRVVESLNLGKRIPDLNARLVDEDGFPFKYAACVTGRYLDENVNAERTGFNIPKENEGLFHDILTFDEIEGAIVDAVEDYLFEYLVPVRQGKADRIRQFVQTKAPQYRSTIKYMNDSFDRISPDLSDEKLETELHKLKFRFNLELKEQTQDLIEANTTGIDDVDDYLEEYNDLLSKISDLSTDQLAEYVLYRKSIISLLDKSLQMQTTNTYLLEEAVHRIIFPMRKSSNEVDYEKQNLWLIDERLSYHYFLASDQRLDQIEVIESESSERPDLIVFNKALAYAESHAPFSSIVIVEFKRPMRNDYKTDDNPFEQVNRYINNIRESKVKDVNGRPIRVDERTSFYVYIVCDITEKVEYLAEHEYDFTKTPDGWGYFNFKKNANAYIELISYTKLVEDAKKRNRVLFEKLNLPGL